MVVREDLVQLNFQLEGTEGVKMDWGYIIQYICAQYICAHTYVTLYSTYVLQDSYMEMQWNLRTYILRTPLGPQ